MEAVKILKELGYVFNADGKLRKLNEKGELSDVPFQFNITDNKDECQSHYEQIGSAATSYVYHLLEAQEGLVKLPVPKDATPETGTFVFVSADYDRKDTLLVLINGSGVVRAGQWARSLIINNSLDTGTQIPYIRKAKAKDYGIIILNTNDKYTADGKKIPDSSTPFKHAKYVWDTYISKVNATSILIVAHSFGGIVTVTLADVLKQKFFEKVKAVALTDSVHRYSDVELSEEIIQIARNWVASDEPLDTEEDSKPSGIPEVSSGSDTHEMTSASCIESVFKFFDEKLAESKTKAA